MTTNIAASPMFNAYLLPPEASRVFVSSDGVLRKTVQYDGITYARPAIRVACITLDGSTVVVPREHVADMIADEEDGYTITFKTITVREFEKMEEFSGF